MISKWVDFFFFKLWPSRSMNGSVHLSVFLSICLSVCHTFLAATKQLYEWFSPSVCPSVRPSHLFDYVHIIMNFQELLPVTEVMSLERVKVRSQRSRSQRSQPNFTISDCNSSLNSHMIMNDAYSLIMLRRGAILFFKVMRQISRSHGSKNRQIWPRLGVSGQTPVWIHQWLQNAAQSLK